MSTDSAHKVMLHSKLSMHVGAAVDDSKTTKTSNASATAVAGPAPDATTAGLSEALKEELKLTGSADDAKKVAEVSTAEEASKYLVVDPKTGESEYIRHFAALTQEFQRSDLTQFVYKVCDGPPDSPFFASARVLRTVFEQRKLTELVKLEYAHPIVKDMVKARVTFLGQTPVEKLKDEPATMAFITRYYELDHDVRGLFLQRREQLKIMIELMEKDAISQQLLAETRSVPVHVKVHALTLLSEIQKPEQLNDRQINELHKQLCGLLQGYKRLLDDASIKVFFDQISKEAREKSFTDSVATEHFPDEKPLEDALKKQEQEAKKNTRKHKRAAAAAAKAPPNAKGAALQKDSDNKSDAKKLEEALFGTAAAASK